MNSPDFDQDPSFQTDERRKINLAAGVLGAAATFAFTHLVTPAIEHSKAGWMNQHIPILEGEVVQHVISASTSTPGQLVYAGLVGAFVGRKLR